MIHGDLAYDNGARWLQFAIGVCFTEEAGRTSQSNSRSIGTTKGGGQPCDELAALSRGEEGGGIRGHDVVPVEIDEQSLVSDVAVGVGPIRHQEQ